MLKRLFFGFNILSTWPDNIPKGRIIRETDRHMTVAFLGNIEFEQLEIILKDIPKPTSPYGFSGIFDKVEFLPHKHPNVVAWHADLRCDLPWVENYYKILNAWLNEKGMATTTHNHFLPHVTLARKPFNCHDWCTQFRESVFISTALNLYESMGGLIYKPIWTHPLLAPFEKISDREFIVRGQTTELLKQHLEHANVKGAIEIVNDEEIRITKN